VLVVGGRAFAIPELYVDECRDGFDNDIDGIVDCSEPACQTSSSSCGFVSGPTAVGIGPEGAFAQFDRPAAPNDPPLTGVRTLLVADLDGSGAQRDDLIIGRNTSFSSLRSTIRPGYMSIPSVVTATQTGPNGTVFATGDYSGDGRTDVVAGVTNGLQRYRSVGTGTFTVDGAVFGDPGVTSALGISGRSIIALNGGRVRVFDNTCTVAPAGFPVNETFGANNLCASIPSPTSVVLGPRMMTVGVRNFVLFITRAANGFAFVRTYELVRSGGVVNLTLQASGQIGNTIINDVDTIGSHMLWGQEDGAVGAMSFNGTSWSNVASMTIPTVLRVANPDPIRHMKIGTFAGRIAVVALGTKDSTLYVVPFTPATGLDLKSMVEMSYGSGAVPAGLALGQFNDDNLTDIAILDSNANVHVNEVAGEVDLHC
jgi:hypothetical protein